MVKVPASPVTCTQMFYDAFPVYLTMGMTYDLYWNSDSTLVRYYRKAYELNVENTNRNMWIQGAYIYDAVSVVAHNRLSDKGKKQRSYPDRPYDLSPKAAEANNELRAEQERLKAIVFFKQLERNFKAKEASERGN